MLGVLFGKIHACGNRLRYDITVSSQPFQMKLRCLAHGPAHCVQIRCSCNHARQIGDKPLRLFAPTSQTASNLSTCSSCFERALPSGLAVQPFYLTCHPERNARLAFPTRIFCGSGAARSRGTCCSCRSVSIAPRDSCRP